MIELIYLNKTCNNNKKETNKMQIKMQDYIQVFCFGSMTFRFRLKPFRLKNISSEGHFCLQDISSKGAIPSNGLAV